MIYVLLLALGIFLTIPVLIVWYLVLPKTYFLTFDGDTPSRIYIFTHLFVSFIVLFIILGSNSEIAFTHPKGTISPMFFLVSMLVPLIFCIYFGRNKINLGDKRVV